MTLLYETLSLYSVTNPNFDVHEQAHPLFLVVFQCIDRGGIQQDPDSSEAEGVTFDEIINQYRHLLAQRILQNVHNI